MKVYSTNGVNFDVTNNNTGWRTFSRTINAPSNYNSVPVITFRASGTGGEMNLNGRATEVAYPQGNQTEISYREWALGLWVYPEYPSWELRVWVNSSTNGQGPIPSYGSPYTQNQIPLGTNPSTGVVDWTLYAKSKDYATTHCWQYTIFCQNWSRIQVIYP